MPNFSQSTPLRRRKRSDVRRTSFRRKREGNQNEDDNSDSDGIFTLASKI